MLRIHETISHVIQNTLSLMRFYSLVIRNII